MYDKLLTKITNLKNKKLALEILEQLKRDQLEIQALADKCYEHGIDADVEYFDARGIEALIEARINEIE